MSEGLNATAAPTATEAEGTEKYFVVFGALTALTVGTVGLSYVDLGHEGNIWAGLLIAALKASLVALIFMHQWWEGRVVRGAAIFPLCLFVLLATVLVVDLTNRWLPQVNIGAWSQHLEASASGGAHH